jgi:hypothetical protein
MQNTDVSKQFIPHISKKREKLYQNGRHFQYVSRSVGSTYDVMYLNFIFTLSYFHVCSGDSVYVILLTCSVSNILHFMDLWNVLIKLTN